MARNKYPVLFNEEQLELRASQVGDIYHQMARDLFDEVIDRLLERGAESLADNPYIWQLERMSQMHMLNEQNLDTISRYSKIGREQLRKVIEDEGFKMILAILSTRRSYLLGISNSRTAILVT